MKPTQQLHDLGQSLWLDNITRTMLRDGTLAGYIDELSVTGLTSNPTIFDNAIKNSAMYDQDISRASSAGLGEDLFFSLALADLTRAADLFRPVPAEIKGNGSRMDAQHDGAGRRPAHKIARLFLLEPAQRDRSHCASRISSPTSATFR